MTNYETSTNTQIWHTYKTKIKRNVTQTLHTFKPTKLQNLSSHLAAWFGCDGSNAYDYDYYLGSEH